MTSRAWTYIGSANFSESAWGKLVTEKTTKLPKLNCRNWECGVIVPATYKERSSTTGLIPDARNLSSYEWRVPVPMRYPGEDLENRRPWFSSEQVR